MTLTEVPGLFHQIQGNGVRQFGGDNLTLIVEQGSAAVTRLGQVLCHSPGVPHELRVVALVVGLSVGHERDDDVDVDAGVGAVLDAGEEL
ncbi:hypothetical protein, partial [Deinococcus sp. 23YEL01]|uniref:hypothetical protein n=1 Tax=Deinococcus sp. 23YEL01 TaxID=2745871 RepID=UPI001E3C2AA0